MSVFGEMMAKLEKDDGYLFISDSNGNCKPAEKAIREAIRQFGFGMYFPDEPKGEILKRNVIGYTIVQMIHSDNSKSIQTVPIVERGDTDFDIKVPENGIVIGVLPVTKRTVAAFGGIPDDDITIKALKCSMFLSFEEYAFLGLESGNAEYDEWIWKERLTELWTEKILKNYNTRLENDLKEE